MSGPGLSGPGGLIAEVVRGGFVESVHLGHLVALDGDGVVVRQVGDPATTFFARSSLKPLQAVAMLRAGLEVDDDGLALACASHSGEAAHLAVARGVLTSVGLDEGALQNTPDLPLDTEAAARWRAEGRGPTSLTQNCSGKHAAMLATCRAAGWPVEDYLGVTHPLQEAVRAVVAELTGEPVEHATVDGCGAPLFSSTLLGLARAFGRIAAAGAAGESSPEGRVARAMARRPDLVGGTGRDVTAIMQAVPGLIAKDGAEGVYGVGLADGSALAFKISDGSGRPRPAVLAAGVEVLLPATADETLRESVRAVGRTPVLGHGAPVGEVRAVLGKAPSSAASAAALVEARP